MLSVHRTAFLEENCAREKSVARGIREWSVGYGQKPARHGACSEGHAPRHASTVRAELVAGRRDELEEAGAHHVMPRSHETDNNALQLTSAHGEQGTLAAERRVSRT